VRELLKQAADVNAGAGAHGMDRASLRRRWKADADLVRTLLVRRSERPATTRIARLYTADSRREGWQRRR